MVRFATVATLLAACSFRTNPATGDAKPVDAVPIDLPVDVMLDGPPPNMCTAASATCLDGTTLETERLLVATGRRPNVERLGLDEIGVKVSPRGIEVDERLRTTAEDVWAIGDVTGVAQFTHVGKYQARVAARDIAKRHAKADYRAIPAGIFTDPEVGTVGRTEGEDLVSARVPLSALPRLSTYERPKREGFIRVFADPGKRVLVGAVCVGPQAAEWLGQFTLAIRAEVTVETLLDTIQPYPTFSEAVFYVSKALQDALD